MERIRVVRKLVKYLTQIMAVFLCNISEICSSEDDLLGEHIKIAEIYIYLNKSFSSICRLLISVMKVKRRHRKMHQWHSELCQNSLTEQPN
jgi:hypothetical protein